MLRMIRVMILMAIGAMVLVGCSSDAATSLISPSDYVAQYQASDTPHLLVDVRTPQEYSEGYIEGSVNIPLQELESRLSEIPQDIPVVVYCRSGNRSAQAADILSKNGYSDIYDLGGVIQWEQNGYCLTQGS